MRVGACTQACTTLQVDLIALNLGRRLPFRLRAGALQAALKRGAHFELAYAPALRDEASRRSFFANATGVSASIRHLL
jgi:ribonuclease P/MRP protein subunit RPP1